MDDSTQDRAAHTPYREVRAAAYFVGLGGPLIKFQWIDESGATQNRDLSGPDVLSMADSHADLLAALEGTIDSLVYVDDNIPGLVGYGVREQRIAIARAAIAKAKGATP